MTPHRPRRNRPGRKAADLLAGSAVAVAVAAAAACGTTPAAAPAGGATPTRPGQPVPTLLPPTRTTAPSPTRSAAPTGTPAAVDPCTGLTGCRVFARTDVDGDGRADRVALGRSGSTLRLAVVTAAGRSASRELRADGSVSDDAWFGSGSVDAAAGRELVTRTTAGAHAQFFEVTTWRDGRLVAEEVPGGRAEGWYVDSALSAVDGVACTGSGNSARVVVTALAGQLSGAGRYTGTVTTYRPTGTGWAATSHRSVSHPLDSEAATGAAGWHCPGLPTGLVG